MSTHTHFLSLTSVKCFFASKIAVLVRPVIFATFTFCVIYFDTKSVFANFRNWLKDFSTLFFRIFEFRDFSGSGGCMYF